MNPHINKAHDDETQVEAVPLGTHFGNRQSAHMAEDRVLAEWGIGDIILDLYEVLQVHKGGGMGLVYRVHHRGWNMDLAVKSPRANCFHTEEQKKEFYRECETWINLGLHPHIVSCHYVRALGGIPRVFSEYVDGGSLKDWIDSRKLYKGDPQEVLKRVLDVAIQMAWGLNYAHEKGLVHQDVKPANVMMTPDGTAKITDFGLAKAREAAGEKVDANRQKSVLASSGGMTPAYCSPEQANKEALSRKTDIWSWAVTVLEMFAGEAYWQSGVAAPDVLKELNDFPKEQSSIVDFPVGMVELLSQCFAFDCTVRPNTFEDVVQVVKAIYESVVRADYQRLSPESIERRADTLNNRAISFLDLGRSSESENLLLEALTIDPTHAEANFNYQLLLWRSGRVTDASAINTLNNLLQVRSEGVAPIGATMMRGTPHLGLALIHAERGDTSSAVRELEAALLQPGGSNEVESLLASYRKCQDAIPSVRSIECKGHEIRSLSASPDGRFVAVGSNPHDESSRDDCLTICNTESGECVVKFDKCRHEYDFMGSPQAHCVAWVSGRRQILTGGLMGPLLLWDIDQQTAIRQFLTHDHVVTALCVSKNGRYALSGSADKTVKLWDLEGCVESINQRRSMSDVGIERGISIVETKEGVPSQRVFTGNKEWVDSVAISTELRLAVSGGEDNSVRVWDLDSGESRGTLLGHEGRVGSVIVIPGLGLIVSGGGDSTVRLWDTSSGKNRGVLRGHTSSITALGFSEATGWLFSAGADGTVRVWDIEAHRCVRTFDNNQIDIEDLVVLDNGRRCLFADRAGVLRIWEPTVGPAAAFILARPRAQVALSEEQLRVRSFTQMAEEAKTRGMWVQAITLIDEARQIEGYEHSPNLLNLRHSYGLPLARRRVCEIFDRYVWREHHGAVRAIAGLAGLAASGGEDGSLILWNLETGKADLHLAAHSGCIRALASNADGTYLVSGGDDGVVRRLNMADRTVLEGRGHYKIVFDVEFSSDGRLAVSGGEDGTLRIWDASTWQCRQTLRVAGQKAPSITDIMSRSILSVAIAPDARSVFTGGEGKLRVWDLERGAPVNTYEQVDMQYIRRLFVMPDGEHMIIGGDRIEGPGSKWVRITACRLIQVSDGRCLEQREGIYPLAVSRDGGLFAAVEGGEIGVYSTQNLSLLTKVASSGAEITAAAFSGDTRFLLIGREDGTIQAMEIIWEYESSRVSYNANCRA